MLFVRMEYHFPLQLYEIVDEVAPRHCPAIEPVSMQSWPREYYVDPEEPSLLSSIPRGCPHCSQLEMPGDGTVLKSHDVDGYLRVKPCLDTIRVKQCLDVGCDCADCSNRQYDRYNHIDGRWIQDIPCLNCETGCDINPDKYKRQHGIKHRAGSESYSLDGNPIDYEGKKYHHHRHHHHHHHHQLHKHGKHKKQPKKSKSYSSLPTCIRDAEFQPGVKKGSKYHQSTPHSNTPAEANLRRARYLSQSDCDLFDDLDLTPEELDIDTLLQEKLDLDVTLTGGYNGKSTLPGYGCHRYPAPGFDTSSQLDYGEDEGELMVDRGISEAEIDRYFTKR